MIFNRFSKILVSFGEAFGELLRDLGGSGASPRGVCSQCFRQGGFRRVPKGPGERFRRILVPFG